MQRGEGAGAALAYLPDGTELGGRAQYLVDVTTPITEYTALICGLQLAHEIGGYGARVKAWGDAELIVRHVSGLYRCRKEELKPLLFLVRSLMVRFLSCEVLELPKAGPKNKRRHLNVAADALAARCMKEQHDIYWRS